MLYNKDCISDQAIVYWYQKGSKPQGKQHFLKATEPLVKVSVLGFSNRSCVARKLIIWPGDQFLEAQEEESEEEE